MIQIVWIKSFNSYFMEESSLLLQNQMDFFPYNFYEISHVSASWVLSLGFVVFILFRYDQFKIPDRYIFRAFLSETQ